MSVDGFSLHAHTYSVSVDTYHEKPGLHKFMDILQTDVLQQESGEDIAFISAMEAREYPIYCTMYHPEYQYIDYVGPGTWEKYENRKNAEEMTFRFSLHLNREARKNSNRLDPKHQRLVHEIDPEVD